MRICLLTTDNREHDGDYDNPQPYFGTAPEALLQGLAAVPEIQTHVVCCVRRPVRSPQKLAPNIYYHSLLVPKMGWMRTLYFGCIKSVRKKIKEIRPDIVHGQGTERDCAISTVFSSFPNVLTIHGNMKAIAEFYRAPIGSFHWLAARLEDFVLPRTAGVFCNSAFTEQLVSPRARKTWRVPNALRMDFFSPMSSAPPRAVPVLLNVGVVAPYKRQVELLAVAARLHQRGCRFELRFAGKGWPETGYGADFQRELVRAEQAGYARHLGNLSTSQLIAAMDGASALVHFPTEEAFGLVVAEALARNLKLFGATTGGVVDVARDVDGAELIESQNFAGLEEAIAKWIKAGAPKPQNAAPVMRQRYHPEIITRQHLEIYRQVLEK